MQQRGVEGTSEPYSPTERVGTFLFAWRNWIFTALLLLVFVGFRPVPSYGDRVWDSGLDTTGFLLCLLGQGFRSVVIGCTSIDSAGRMKKVAAKSLTTTGIFAHVRNPLYIANLLVVFGLALIHNNPLVYAIAIPTMALSYSAIVASEEAFLRRRFGQEYVEYCRRVPRWLPRFRGILTSLRDAHFDGRRVLLQEYGSIWIAVALPIVLILREWWGAGLSVLRDAWIYTGGSLLVLVTILWAWCFIVKRGVVRQRLLEEELAGAAS